MEVQLFDRYSGKIENEKIYGESFINFAYNSPLGQALIKVVPLKFVSELFGRYQDLSFSAKKIEKFVSMFKINMDDFEQSEKGFRSFNDFFERKLKSGKRVFVSDKQMPAFCEARYLGYNELDAKEMVPVKGYNLSISDLIENSELAKDFNNGPVIIARLAPVDYHRFHFPDDGTVLKSYRVKGEYHSVNPIALKHDGKILIKNEREVSLLDCKTFGKILYVEVGAMCVGKIKQTYQKMSYKRGEEKGTFLFGGSTVVIVGQKGKWKIAQDILENSERGIETYVRLGDLIGIGIEIR